MMEIDDISSRCFTIIDPDNTEPSVRKGRKAAGLINRDGRAAEG